MFGHSAYSTYPISTIPLRLAGELRLRAQDAGMAVVGVLDAGCPVIGVADSSAPRVGARDKSEGSP